MQPSNLLIVFLMLAAMLIVANQGSSELQEDATDNRVLLSETRELKQVMQQQQQSKVPRHHRHRKNDTDIVAKTEGSGVKGKKNEKKALEKNSEKSAGKPPVEYEYEYETPKHRVTKTPTHHETKFPTPRPTHFPTYHPTHHPTHQPTFRPTHQPTPPHSAPPHSHRHHRKHHG